MKIKNIILAFAIALASVLAIPMANVFARDCNGAKIIDGASCPSELQAVSGNNEDKIKTYVGNVLKVLFVVVGVLAVIVIIYSGITYMTAAGDPGKIAGAKKALMYAVIGLVIAMLAFAIVSFILGAI